MIGIKVLNKNSSVRVQKIFACLPLPSVYLIPFGVLLWSTKAAALESRAVFATRVGDISTKPARGMGSPGAASSFYIFGKVMLKTL
jgi:hypothetical protein